MEQYRVREGEPVRLHALDPRDSNAFTQSKQAGKARVKKLANRLEVLQELLYAEGRHKVLIVLQGMGHRR